MVNNSRNNDNIVLSEEEIKRNKELFEYEATEIILSLKDKFAQINGKNLYTSEIPNEIKKPEIISKTLEIEVHMAEIPDEIKKPKIISKIPEIKVPSTKVICLKTSILGYKTTNINVKTELDFQTEQKTIEYNPEKIKSDKATISVDSKIKTIDFKKISGVNIKYFHTDEFKSKNINTGDIQCAKVDISEYKSIIIKESEIKQIYIPEKIDDTYSSIGIKVKSPEIKILSIESTTNIFDILKEVCSYMMPGVTTQTIVKYVAPEIETEKAIIKISHPKNIKDFKSKKVKIHTKKNINMPETINTDVLLTKPIASERENIPIKEISALKLKKDSLANLEIKVAKAKINFGYSSIKSFEIPNTKLKTAGGIIIYKKPDYSDLINEIIRLAGQSIE